MKTAIYAGSFDPLTNGHINVIEKAMDLFDELFIIIGDNPNKTSHFTHSEREDIIEKSIKKISLSKKRKNNCIYHIDTFRSRFIVDYAKEQGAQYLVRGLRNTSDFDKEKEMYFLNKELGGDIETVFIMPDKEVENLSSSIIRGSVGYVGWEELIKDKVPEIVITYLKQKNFINRFNKTIDNLELMFDTLKYERKSALSQLISNYDETVRPYHNTNHILHMLELLDTIFIGNREYRTLLEYSIFFHDFFDEAVFGDVAIDNSIKAALAFLTHITDQSVYSLVINELIGCTKYSDRLVRKKENYSKWQKIMMDLDFSAMGNNYEKFNNNSLSIRKEYNGIPKAQFTEGRMKFLNSILDIEKIFLSEHFDHLENNARENIKKELEGMKNGTIIF